MDDVEHGAFMDRHEHAACRQDAGRSRPHAPIALLARHPKVSETQNGARSTFVSFDRLAIRFSHNTPQDISGVFCENRLASRSKLTKVERAPFWVYCSLLWVHVDDDRATLPRRPRTIHSVPAAESSDRVPL
eukprot:COSAG01_NODE_652_length_14497_cov_38.547968_7_plen_132_part_00